MLGAGTLSGVAPTSVAVPGASAFGPQLATSAEMNAPGGMSLGAQPFAQGGGMTAAPTSAAPGASTGGTVAPSSSGFFDSLSQGASNLATPENMQMAQQMMNPLSSLMGGGGKGKAKGVTPPPVPGPQGAAKPMTPLPGPAQQQQVPALQMLQQLGRTVV